MFAINLLTGAVFLLFAVMCLRALLEAWNSEELDTVVEKGILVCIGLTFYAVSATIGTHFVLQAYRMI